LLIFTPIFSPKTNKSYKITLFGIANHPIFQNFPQKPLNFDFFIFFFPFFSLFFYLLCFCFSSSDSGSFSEPVCETIVAGDINGDCIVNLKDFALIAFHWLEEK